MNASRERPVVHGSPVRIVSIDRLTLCTSADTYTPQPESVALIRWMLQRPELLPVNGRVVDLCAGVGTLGLLLARSRPDVLVDAVEISEPAHALLALNIARQQHCSMRPHLADVSSCLPGLDGQIDMVISNPPYVATHELADLVSTPSAGDPQLAVDGGQDGLEVIDKVQRRAQRLLRHGGWLAIEHSDRQGESAAALLLQHGWRKVKGHPDQDDRPRFVTAHR